MVSTSTTLRTLISLVAMNEMGTHKDSKDTFGDKQSMPHSSVENAYFLLDLKLPNPKLDIQSKPAQDGDSYFLKKYGFLELLENVHNNDMKTNNPWLNPAVTVNTQHWRKRYKKQVRFSSTEISPASLPHCRRNGNFGQISEGRLHAARCRNATQETFEVLSDRVWLNRVFILETSVCCPTSRADFYSLQHTEEGCFVSDGGENRIPFEDTFLNIDTPPDRMSQDVTSSSGVVWDSTIAGDGGGFETIETVRFPGSF